MDKWTDGHSSNRNENKTASFMNIIYEIWLEMIEMHVCSVTTRKRDMFQ